MMKSIPRSSGQNLPYHLDNIVVSYSEGVRIDIVPLDQSVFRLRKFYVNGMTSDIVEFLVQNGRCFYCNGSISGRLERCSCERPNEDDGNVHLSIRYHSDLHHAQFNTIFERESSRAKNRARQRRIEENGGTHTQDEILKLCELQECLCYFCGVDFSDGSKGKHFHVDHFDSIFDGGRNDLKNLVLTCANCNKAKGTMSGAYFELKAKKIRSSEIGRRLGVIRRKVNAFKASLP